MNVVNLGRLVFKYRSNIEFVSLVTALLALVDSDNTLELVDRQAAEVMLLTVVVLVVVVFFSDELGATREELDATDSPSF